MEVNMSANRETKEGMTYNYKSFLAAASITIGLNLGALPIYIGEVVAQGEPDSQAGIKKWPAELKGPADYFRAHLEEWDSFVKAIKAGDSQQAVSIGKAAGLTSDQVREIIGDAKRVSAATSGSLGVSRMLW
jgi:hypothetical protein